MYLQLSKKPLFTISGNLSCQIWQISLPFWCNSLSQFFLMKSRKGSLSAMNKNEFFREATLRICGDLEIGKAMRSFLQYIQDVMPADRLFLEYYDRNEKVMRTIADATSKKGESVDLITPLSDDAIAYLKEKYGKGAPDPYYYEKPHEVSVARELLDFHHQEAESLLVLPLGPPEKLIGIVTFVSIHAQYNETHLELASLLKEPFQVAMSNAMKHRNELRLFDREFFFEVTKRICGTLEIEKGLQECLFYLSKYMPANYIHLEKYEENLGLQLHIAKATFDKAETNYLLHLPKDVEGELKKLLLEIQEGKHPPVLIFNDPDKEPVLARLRKAKGHSDFSVIALSLLIENQLAGLLVLHAKGKNRFTEDHAKLLSLLKLPFFIALSNALEHRNVLRLLNRDFFYEVTKRLCGSLDFDKALVECVRFLRQEMPVDLIFFQIFDENMKAMRIVAVADQEEGKTINRWTPLSDEAISEMEGFGKELRESRPNHVWLFPENPYQQILTREIAEFNNFTMTSLMVMPLGLDGSDELIGRGSLVMATAGEEKFSKKHKDLLSLLKEPFAIAIDNILHHLEIIQLKELLTDDNRYLQRELRRISGDEIVGANFGLKDTMHKVQQVAGLNSPVLILGETGVGKDVIANAIHYSSPRKDGPFVSVNCGAIPEALIDSELFGHEKGAFTGALSQKRGRFERANHGTIFLDEIGELPPEAQVRLLKVLQDKEIERVGGTETIHLDIRIIAATNRNLKEMVAARQFREDLWFRLNVFPIIIPPLRERKSDIPDLLQHFIDHKTKDMKLPEMPRVSAGATDLLMNYDWPGNVRELENVVERSMILNPSGPLTFEHMNLDGETGGSDNQEKTDEELTLDELTARYIRKALSNAKGKIHGQGGAADLLGINPSTLRNRMNKLGIEYRKNDVGR